MFLFSLFFSPFPSYAQDKLAFSSGIAYGRDAHKFPWLMLEYRSSKKLLWFSPWIGYGGTDQDVYGAFGLDLTFKITSCSYFRISSGAGAYHGEEGGLELGFGLEFLSSAEFLYQISNKFTLGIKLSHISNASLGDSNPGAQMISTVILVPIGN